MSTPNNNKPSPAAVEQALAERQANSEKINATVEQAARHPSLAWSPYLVVSPCRVALDAHPSGDMGVIARLKRERDLLQAQRDELLAAFQPIWQEWHKVPYDNQAMNKAVRAMFAVQAAIARATEGGTGQ